MAQLPERPKSSVREVYGRTVQASEESYFLPADKEEFIRLDAQHKLITTKMDGLYAAPEEVERILAPRTDGTRPKVLDVGTGSGIWAIEMAERFPHASVIGIDLIPVLPNESVPTNCKFEIGNANHGFSKYAEGFDVIHFRFAGFGMTPWVNVLQHAKDSLQPGGIILLVGPMPLTLYDGNKRSVELKDEADPSCSFVFLVMAKAIAGIAARSPEIADTVKSDTILQNMKGFSEPKKELLLMPVGAWDPAWSAKEKFIGEIQKRSMKMLLRAWTPVILDQWYPSDAVDRWISKAEEEITSLSRHYFTEGWANREGMLRLDLEGPVPTSTEGEFVGGEGVVLFCAKSDPRKRIAWQSNVGASITFMTSTTSVPLQEAVQQVHGRTVQANDKIYFLPADDIEKSRLDLQHLMFKLQLDGLYAAPNDVERILAPRASGRQPSVLDIGTGSGIWAIEMAEKFPHATVVGLDIAPVNSSKEIPPNCRFDMGNVNDGLSQYPEGFDVIHLRFANFGIAPWKDMLSRVHTALHPGGILLVVGAAGRKVRDENMQEVIYREETDPEVAWFKFIMENAAVCVQSRSPTHEDHLQTAELLNEIGGWARIEKNVFYMYLGDWDPALSAREKYIAQLHQKVFIQVPAAWRPMLLVQGFPLESVDRWIAKTEEELTNLTKHYRTPWYTIWAIKEGEAVVS